MNLKKELVISIVMIIVFTIVGLNMNALAADNQFTNLTLTNKNNVVNTNTSNSIQFVNTANGINNNTNTNTSNENLANTGLEDLPYLVITLLAVSAIFTYKKIKEYKAY